MAQATPNPTRIELHQQQRVLDIGFDDGSEFHFPCEYLRVYSPSEEAKLVREDGEAIEGKERVGITEIIPVGSYAVRLVFDDKHRTGIYTWEQLYDLGRRQASLWQEYLDTLATNGQTLNQEARGKLVRVLYGATLADRLDREGESLRLPTTVATIADLLAQLRERGGEWQQLRPDALRITLAEQVVPADTRLPDGSEVALAPV